VPVYLTRLHPNWAAGGKFLYRCQRGRSNCTAKHGVPGVRGKPTEIQDEAIAIATELGMKPLLERVLGQREILKT